MKNTLHKLVKIVFLTITLCFIQNSIAQSPQKMSYQMVVRNPSNQLVANSGVAIQVSILASSMPGSEVYIETHSATTNANGLATFEIGNGSILLGNFSTINWSSGTYLIKIDVDPTSSTGTNYTISSTTQLLSVPYALYAEKSGSSNSWGLTGNTGTNASTNFIGTTDDVDLVFKRNNTKAGLISFNTNNTALGIDALPSSAGAGNVAIGNYSLNSNTTGFRNNGIGYYSLQSNIDGNQNVAFGNNALEKNIDGSFNAALGDYALQYNTSGAGNTSVGFQSLNSNTSGLVNTAVGQEALYNNTSGWNNVAIGNNSLTNITTGNNNIGIGATSYVLNPSGDNQLSIGNVIFGTDMGNTLVGKIGIGTLAPSEKLDVNGKTKTADLQVTNNASIGKILTSDATGNATWQMPTGGIVGVYAFNGYATAGPFSSMTSYAFVGPTTTVTITSSTQKIFGNAIAPIATTTGTTSGVQLGLGYQLSPTGSINNFVGGNYAIINIDSLRSPQAVSGYVTGLVPGTYTIGVVILNNSTTAINNNDFVNGWVMVTN